MEESKPRLLTVLDVFTIALFLSSFYSNAQSFSMEIDHISIIVKDIEKSEGTKSEKAAMVGKLVAEKALAAGITEVVFDRSGYLYHGRVKQLADAAREGGLKF